MSEKAKQEPKERRALVGNADDPAQVEDGRRREQMVRNRQLNDLRVVMSMKEGRRFLWRLMDQCKLFATPIAHDARYTDYNIGKGEIGRFLLSECQQSTPDGLLLMQREAMEEALPDV